MQETVMAENWTHNYPSVTLSRPYDQSNAYADLFRGEANKLLYELKNLMKFRNLKQLRMTRFFTDGTVITAMSVFGVDTVNIDISKAITTTVAAEEMCTITLLDLPDAVQPMETKQTKTGEITDPDLLADEIEEEVSGTDYIKTYYRLDVSRCRTCAKFNVDISFNYSIPEEEEHYQDDVNEHLIWSLDRGGYGNIITHGSDEGGTYFIWKAFTEGMKPYSKTGYGIISIKTSIVSDADPITHICESNDKVVVDCCQKESGLREAKIYWSGITALPCDSFIIYEGEHLCEMPTSMKFGYLKLYADKYHGLGPLYAVPEVEGGCIPFLWSLDGSGQLLIADYPDGPQKEAIYQVSLESDCHTQATLRLSDRCGSEYEVVTIPCCDYAEPLSISYTSLLMSCNGQQTFTAGGGCGPYTWEITSGGGTLSEPTGNEVVYTAPATNANCTSNPTVQVTDCCGVSESISLAVNCYALQPALTACSFELTGHTYCTTCSGIYCIGVAQQQELWGWKWDCAGNLLDSCNGSLYDTASNCPCLSAGNPCETPPTGCVTNCQCKEDCTGPAINWPPCQFTTWPCDTYDGILNDNRTVDQKNGGCCPLNPLTGLPY